LTDKASDKQNTNSGKPKKKTGKNSVISDFANARKLLIGKYQTFRNLPQYMKVMFSNATYSRLLDTEKFDNNYFKETTQKRLVWCVAPLNPLAYHQLAHAIGQTTNQQKLLLDNYQGHYHFFRYIQANTEQKPIYTSGQVWLEQQADFPAFRLKPGSSDGGSNPDIEYIGYVFLTEKQIYLFGHRRKSFRMAITELGEEPESIDPRSYIFSGTVASVRAAYPLPFGAQFLMVHHDNEKTLSALTPTKNDNGAAEKNFKELCKTTKNPRYHQAVSPFNAGHFVDG
jgi:hypothetical protein